MKYMLGFIGCGNMGGALIKACVKGVSDRQIAVYDPLKEKADAFENTYQNVHYCELTELLNESEYIFLGVKPQMLENLFTQIGDTLINRTTDYTLISMAAGTSIAKIEALVKTDCAVIRIMPNTSVAVSSGVVLYCHNKKAESKLSGFLQALSCAGVVDAIDESKIDAASAVSGCGPAFVYMFIEALADGGVECGLPRDKALLYAEAMVEGAAKSALESALHPGILKDAVCSPGGTTIAGVHALENKGFRGAVANAVVSAYQKTLSLK